MRGHIQAKFSAFCLVLAVPVSLPVLWRLGGGPGGAWDLCLPALSLASSVPLWVTLGLAAGLLVIGFRLRRRRATRNVNDPAIIERGNFTIDANVMGETALPGN